MSKRALGEWRFTDGVTQPLSAFAAGPSAGPGLLSEPVGKAA
jgi:hypothetical protein